MVEIWIVNAFLVMIGAFVLLFLLWLFLKCAAWVARDLFGINILTPHLRARNGHHLYSKSPKSDQLQYPDEEEIYRGR